MGEITQLGYIGFQVSDLAAWEKYGTQVMGLEISRRYDDGGFSLRMDSRESRIFVEPGPADDLCVLGFEAADAAALGRVVERLRAAGVEVREGSAEQAARRGVQKLFLSREPGGAPIELYTGPAVADAPFVPKVYRSGFVAEEQGWGHLALRANDLHETERFFRELIGAELSDRIICQAGKLEINITFLHLNERHHSVAFGLGLPKHVHHFMLQVRDFNDVGLAMDRVVDQGYEIIQTLGRHPNDRMIGFYSATPSGFQLEIGWGGRTITEGWEPETHPIWTEWGHRPPAMLRGKKPKVAEPA
jgi:2,3-dihydroxybiphenyl 1,2-dioxygenase